VLGPCEVYATLALVPFGMAGLAVAGRYTSFVDAGRRRPLLLGVSAVAAGIVLIREVLS
jgi:hypothetical protein